MRAAQARAAARTATPAKRHRHVGGVGALGHREACAAAPLQRIHENSATTMRHQNAGRRLEIDHYGMGAGAEPGDCPTCR
jgi:hypothetical protein